MNRNNIIGYQPKQPRGATKPPRGGTGESGHAIQLRKEDDDDLPHLSGKARCLQCKHEWVAVCPVGTEWLECPECHSIKGHMLYSCLREDTAHWTCGCGNDLFYVVPEGIYCPNCGEWQNGY